MTKSLVVGVLALQGAFVEHIQHFEKCLLNFESHAFDFIEVRTALELEKCDALVIPGGESTAISLIAERTGVLDALYSFVNADKPIWGTCAGLIFLSKQIVNGRPGQRLLGGMDIEVKRNAFGRQLDSFDTPLDFSAFIPGCTLFPTTFIRAPVISRVLSEKSGLSSQDSSENDIIYSDNNYTNHSPVQILHQLDNGLVVAVRQGNKLGTSFHPELSNDSSFHQWFLQEFVIA